MNKQWKIIEGYENYMVCEDSRVKNIVTNHLISPVLFKCGYLYVNLRKDKKSRPYRLHRIVAKAFIPNPNNLETVNHKDLNKLNNDVSNLEWMSVADNNRHARKHINFNKSDEFMQSCKQNVKKAQLKTSKRVGLIENGKIIQVFKSINQACKEMHTTHQSIVKNKNKWIILEGSEYARND